MTRRYETFSEEETLALAIRIGKSLLSGNVVAFFGGMGMGKTLFTRGLAEGIGIPPAQVSSPTFAIVNRYEGGGKTLLHFDMYRITDEESLYLTGYFDLAGDEILAIEWSENITDFLPKNAVRVTIAQGDDENTRIITIEDNRGRE